MSLQRKVILDMDPGFGDALALALALAAPEVEVVAVTATGGNVAPREASRNVHAIIEYLDPPRRPRIGQASEDQILRTDARQLNGPDGLCGANLDMVDLESIWQEDDSKVLHDLIRRHYRWTGSQQAARLLDNWQEAAGKFVKVIPIDYRQALERLREQEAVGGEQTPLTEEVFHG